jgi:hypothetical protein
MRATKLQPLLTPAITLALAATTFAADFYVAPDGDDANPGTIDRPFATLAAARNAVREKIAAGLGSDLTVLVRGGTYRLAETVVFGLDDSGTDEHSITYAAYPGETPVLSSGVPITRWRKPGDDPPGLPAEARGKVWVADLPEGIGTFRTLYEGPVRLPRARGPGFTPTVSYARTASPDSRTTLRFPRGAIRKWPNLGDAEILVVPQYPWSSNILPLASVDEEAGTARTAVPSTYPMGRVTFGVFPGGTCWVENVVEALDKPGEWVLDTQARKLYLWPRGERPGEAIAAPRLTELLRVEGRIDYDGPADAPVRNLVFRGLTFTQGDRWPWEPGRIGWGLQHDWEMFDRPTALVRLDGAEGCVIQGCRFVQSGGAAVRLDLHCRGNRVDGNQIEHVGGVGILLAGYGPGTKDVNRNNEVTNNHIHHVGELLWDSPGIFAWQSGENHIAHNLIHDTPYTAIVVSGRIAWVRDGSAECSRTIRWQEVDKVLPEKPSRPSWHEREPFLHGRRNLVEMNEIHHAMQRLADGNCIYISGTGGGNVVRNNYLHDVDSPNVNANVRCDDDQHGTIIERNVIFRSCGEGFISKGNNTIRNNVVVDLRSKTTGGDQCRHQRGYLVFPYGSVEGSLIERNIFYAREKGQKLLYENRGGRRPASLLRECRADYNLYYCEADPEWGDRHLREQRAFGVEEHSVAADPLFVDPDHGDLRLKDGSPALKLGFEPIDITNVGPVNPR